MLDLEKDTTIESRPIFRLPRLTHTSKSARCETSSFDFVDVQLSALDQAQFSSSVASHGLDVLTQLTWALVLREYVGVKDQVDIVFGVLQHSSSQSRLKQQSLSLKHATKVSDALIQLATSRAEDYSHFAPSYPVQTAVHVWHGSNTYQPEQRDASFPSTEYARHHGLKLILIVKKVSDMLTGRLLYDSREIESFFASSLSQAFSATLTHIAANLSARIGDISCLAPKQENQIRLWNSGRLSSWSCKLHHIFERTALIRGQNVAIESYDGNFTFEQLNRLSDAALSTLQECGVKAGDFVGHCFHLGPYAIVATLAIFKAGCVLVPLDPTHPYQRHSSMLQDAHARLLLSDRYNKHQEQSLGVSIVSIDLDSLQGVLSQPKGIETGLEDVTDDAVICFTSGSSGTPKGIVQTHEGLTTMVRALTKRLRIDSNARVSGLHPYIFDVSIMEAFSAFLSGAVLCIPRKDDMMMPHPHDLGEALADYAITHTVLSPTMLKTLDPSQVPSMRSLASMGESLDHSLVHRWTGRQQLELFQLWGTTEASILQSCTDPLQPGQHPQCVGKALPETCRLWIVDCRDHHRLVPVGAIGELVVEGPTLARGYLGNETKSTSSFVCSPNWLNLEQNYKVYKTGDLARYDSDGSIVFIGRQDDQVNFHGERVELGEIDYRLLQLSLPGVTDIFSDFIWDTQTIITFCCLKKAQQPFRSLEIVTEDINQLRDVLKGAREQLRQHLPSYVVPQSYIPISKRPVTVTGKTDRRALRKLVAGLSETDLQAFSILGL